MVPPFSERTLLERLFTQSYFKSNGQNNVDKNNSDKIKVKVINSPFKKEKRKASHIESDDESEEQVDVPQKAENVKPSEDGKHTDQHVEICEKAESDSALFTGKRKTARKQMNSLNILKNNVQEVSVNNISMAVATESKPLAKDASQSPEPSCKENEIEDSEKLTVKHRDKASDKGGSHVAKKSKKDTMHSFFSPLKVLQNKKSEEKENTESKKTTVDACDSPLKKKKRIQCLESDDESNDAPNKETALSRTESESKKNREDEPTSREEIETNSQEQQQKAEILDVRTNIEVNKLTSQSSNKVLEGKQKFGAESTAYDPSKSSYHPIEDAIWKRNGNVPYLALSKTLEWIEKTSGRLKTIEILSNFFRSVIVLCPHDLLPSVYLCLNRVAPEYEGIEIGVGETLLMKAVAQATGRTVEKIKAEVALKGDLGLVSESSRGNQRVMFPLPKLTVSAVFNKFRQIAKMSGNAVMSKKTEMIKNLFIACRECEAKYIIRSLSGKLRIGLAEQSVLCALARAAVMTPPGQSYPPQQIDASQGTSPERFKEFLDSQTVILKTAYCECPNYDILIPVLLREGVSGLPDHCRLSPGIPLKPMLAHPTTGIGKVLQRFDKQAFTCEFKYDGERAQIHMNDENVIKIFSRNQEDTTSKFPDILSRIQSSLKESTKSFILDSEVVAFDREKKQILPFQVLSTRKRKDAVECEVVVQVCVVAFDLLYLNGESLVKRPLKERRNLLHSSFKEVEDQFMFAKFRDGHTEEAMQEFLDESVRGNCEGLMVKALEEDASYEIAKRSHNWLKLKKDYLQGVGDTLDLVVIGGYYGKGKRTGNYGGFLLACYDADETQEYQSICKLGTGLKDGDLEAHTKFFKQYVIESPRSDYRYDPSLEPDNWFEPVRVWEIKCADLSISPVHKAAIGTVDPSKGISLRFPRFVRIREDKTPEEATTAVQISHMYKEQQQIQNSSKAISTNEDYY